MTCDIAVKAYTNAAGFLDGEHFKGSLEIAYELEFRGTTPGFALPETVNFKGDGTFDIVLK